MKLYKRVSLILLLLSITFPLFANPLDLITAAMRATTTPSYTYAFPGPLFQKLSSATVYEGSLAIQLHDGIVAMQLSALFAQEGDAIISFKSAEEYLASDCFIASLHPSFLLQSDIELSEAKNLMSCHTSY